MSTERDELADVLERTYDLNPGMASFELLAQATLNAGYRKIFDGDCGLSNTAPDEREAAEAWMRWANLVDIDGGEPNGIAAMQQMLTEFGYRKPRTVTTVEELDALPVGSVVLRNGRAFQRYKLRPDVFGEYQEWKCADGGFVRSSKDGSSILPATVLHTPEVGA